MFADFEFDMIIDESTQEIKDFIKKHHYLKSVSRGNEFIFTLRVNGQLRGVALFGEPVGTTSKSVYGNCIELKRFCLLDCPKNTASWFMSRCIRYLRHFTDYSSIITYADPAQGHEGIIYQASNYQFLGKQKYPSTFIMYNGKKLHLRNAYDKNVQPRYDNIIKLRRKNKLKVIYSAPKLIYQYKLVS